jgi:hypothetical protein
MIDSKQLRKQAKKILKDEGVVTVEEYNELSDLVLPGLETSKNILETIQFKPPQRFGLLGKIKNFIQRKIIFTVINVIEKQSMRQQKFNSLSFKAFKILEQDIERLEKEIELLKKEITKKK